MLTSKPHWSWPTARLSRGEPHSVIPNKLLSAVAVAESRPPQWASQWQNRLRKLLHAWRDSGCIIVRTRFYVHAEMLVSHNPNSVFTYARTMRAVRKIPPILRKNGRSV
jgi:hypothetical protein